MKIGFMRVSTSSQNFGAQKDLLEDYAKKGNTVFFSSHILSDIDEICNRVGVIHNSELCFSGTAKQFKTKYKSDSLERAFLEIIKS